jgi:hypothetical protein
VLIGYMDMAVSMPTWLGAYQKALDGKIETVQAEDEAGAIDYADSVVRMTQAAGSAKDLASIQRGGELLRLFTTFYSAMSIVYNQFGKAVNQYQQDKNLPHLIGSAVMLWFAPVVLEEWIRGRGPDDDDDESWAAYLARKGALFPLGTVPFIRDIASAVEWRMMTGMTDFSGAPALEAGEAIVNGIWAAARMASAPFSDDTDITRKDVKDAIMAGGYIGHLPSRQLWQTGDYLFRWWTGDLQPDNAWTGIYEALVTGEKR